MLYSDDSQPMQYFFVTFSITQVIKYMVLPTITARANHNNAPTTTGDEITRVSNQFHGY